MVDRITASILMRVAGCWPWAMGSTTAPALATAEVGVARGARGSALSVAAADVVVPRSELGGVPAVVELARRAEWVGTQDLVFAATVIVSLVA